MDKIFAAIGGGELRTKSTLPIDRELAEIAKARAGERRANALFLPTASYDSLPYFNTFRKTYTTELGMKADVALLTKKDVPLEKNAAKIASADLIYLGGGNTLHLIEVIRARGIDKLLWEAYERGAVLTGLSAGGICWFEKMYSDAEKEREEENYKIFDGLGKLKGMISPHYNHRQKDFDRVLAETGGCAYAVEDNAALLFVDGVPRRVLSAGGCAYFLEAREMGIVKKKF
jgi:dipeptidase E